MSRINNYPSDLIIKPDNDNRSYETFVLNNGLRVFLIIDKDSTVSATSLNVNIGSMYDTVDGIAHFLEHMLFMGSTKYPEEDHFMKFITMHGGSTNAFTSHDNTCYYFTINNDGFKECLDIFAQFFISPLLNEDAIQREINAVHSEHQKNLTSDDWREFQLLKIQCHSNHPFSKFSTGSLETLKIPHIHQELKRFYNGTYTSDKMILTVFTNSRDTIIRDITKIFSKIPRRQISIDPKCGILLTTNKIIKYLPVKDRDKVTIVWEIPSFSDDPKKSPIPFLLEILNNQTENSLYSHLSGNLWVSRLDVDLLAAIRDRAIIHITIKLMNNAINYVGTVVNTVFTYIEMLIERIENNELIDVYNDMMTMKSISFKYAEKIGPEDLITMIPECITSMKIDPREVLIIPYLGARYDDIKDNLIQTLKHMIPKNSLVFVSSRLFKDKLHLYEKMYGANYSLINNVIFEGEVDRSSLKFPIKNPFIPNNADNIVLIEKTDDPIPKRIDYQIPYICAFYQFNSSCKVPKTDVIIKIHLPEIMQSVNNYVSMVLYINTSILELNDKLYQAKGTECYGGISIDGNNVYIQFIGFTSIIYKVIEIIIKKLQAYSITDKFFTTISENLKRKLTNVIYIPPYAKAELVTRKHLAYQYYDYKDSLGVIDKIDRYTALKHVRNIFNKGSVDIFVCGNQDRKLLDKIVKLTSRFNIEIPIRPSIESIRDLHTDIIIQDIENPDDKNSAVCYAFRLFSGRIGDQNWERKYCLSKVLNSIIGHEYFDQLRTREQLGYIASSKLLNLDDPYMKSTYLTFIVQSDKKPEYLIHRTDLFIDSMHDHIKNMTNEDFNNYIDGSEFKNPFTRLSELASYNFAQIDDGRYIYNKRDILYDTMRSVRKDELLKFYEDQLLNSRDRLVVGIRGNSI